MKWTFTWVATRCQSLALFATPRAAPNAAARALDHRRRLEGFGALTCLAAAYPWFSGAVASTLWLPIFFGLLWPWFAWRWRQLQRSADRWLQPAEVLATAYVVGPFPPVAALALGAIVLVAHLHRWGHRVLGTTLVCASLGALLGRACHGGLAPAGTGFDGLAVGLLVVATARLALTSHSVTQHLALARRTVTLQAKAQWLLNARLRRYLPPALCRRLQWQPRRLLALERGWVTTTFIDWVGFTALTERLSEVALTRVMNGYRRATETAARRHGVSVVKHLGDGVMLVAGDHDGHSRASGARACVAASQDVLEGVVALACAWRRDGHQVDAAVRIGVASGFCTIGDWGAHQLEYTVIGRSVNLASRLQQLATVNGIAVCERTAALLPGAAPPGWHWTHRRLTIKGIGSCPVRELARGEGVRPQP